MEGKWRQMCGGTLIDDQHALSAAHCFIGDDFASGMGHILTEKYKFYFNFYSRNGSQNFMQSRKAKWIKCHEKYVQQKRGLYNDIWHEFFKNWF